MRPSVGPKLLKAAPLQLLSHRGSLREVKPFKVVKSAEKADLAVVSETEIKNAAMLPLLPLKNMALTKTREVLPEAKASFPVEKRKRKKTAVTAFSEN